jgi:catechol 2,3-dioxygenase-like lactoylglutathione lyase family enzyme
MVARSEGGKRLPRTGFIDHIGIAVPDLAAAKQHYDDLTHVLGLRPWFRTTFSVASRGSCSRLFATVQRRARVACSQGGTMRSGILGIVP